MSDKPAETAVAAPKSKKMLLIVVVAVLILALGGGGAWVYVSKQRAAAEADEEEVVAKPASGQAPTYLALDNMVVNLADPGGEKVAQIGITLELTDSNATEKVKQFLPTIRSGVLLLVSQRTSEELLQRVGKEKLAADILRESGRPFGGGEEVHDDEVPKKEAPVSKKSKAEKKAKAKAHDEMPVRRVLFSSFIVQ